MDHAFSASRCEVANLATSLTACVHRSKRSQPSMRINAKSQTHGDGLDIIMRPKRRQSAQQSEQPNGMDAKSTLLPVELDRSSHLHRNSARAVTT